MAMFNFAHLLGRAPSASAQDDDDKEKSKKSKARKAEDDSDDEEAEEDDDGIDAEDDDDEAEDDKEQSRKGKKARAEEDDDDDEKDDENRDVKKGRKAERHRCAAIFASDHAAGRPALAASLAFNTTMSAKSAIAVLAGSGLETSAGRVSLDARMQHIPNVKIGADAEQSGKSASALVNKAASLYNQAAGKK
ncbi:hypothetical protein [Sodalis sp. C49]|uniref:hypothetical protein n=1 Tax=Sodalis sp. C49 TaxID=3228929 RepID=UPI0039659BB2